MTLLGDVYDMCPLTNTNIQSVSRQTLSPALFLSFPHDTDITLRASQASQGKFLAHDKVFTN